MKNEEARFTLSQVAEATDVSVNTIRSWYQRGHFKLGLADKANPDVGLARHVSWRTAIAIGIAGQLTKMGVHPARAGRAANSFAHTASPDWRTGIERIPGCLWSDDEPSYTVLLIPAGDRAPLHAQILRVPIKGCNFVDVFNSQLFGPEGPMGATVLILDFLVMDFFRRLGLNETGDYA